MAARRDSRDITKSRGQRAAFYSAREWPSPLYDLYPVRYPDRAQDLQEIQPFAGKSNFISRTRNLLIWNSPNAVIRAQEFQSKFVKISILEYRMWSIKLTCVISIEEIIDPDTPIAYNPI